MTSPEDLPELKPTGRRVLVSLGSGLASTAIGIALAASKVEGVVLEVISWGAVGTGLVLAAIGLIGVHAHRRRSRAEDPMPATSLDDRAAACGRRIVEFSDDRAAAMPRAGPSAVDSIRHPMRSWAERNDLTAARDAYDRDTVVIYDRRFGSEVRNLIEDLLDANRIAENEAQLLLYPQDAEGIKLIGRRLIELGTFPGGGEARAA